MFEHVPLGEIVLPRDHWKIDDGGSVNIISVNFRAFIWRRSAIGKKSPRFFHFLGLGARADRETTPAERLPAGLKGRVLYVIDVSRPRENGHFLIRPHL